MMRKDTPRPSEPGSIPRKGKQATPPGLAALFCILAALFVLITTLPQGGIPPEFVLFCVLALIFGALWWIARGRNI